MSEQREILFRGKRVDSNAWIEGPYVPGWASGYIYLAEQHPKMVMVYRETVGQYTGINDRNGKRIFERDIVTIDGGDGYFLVKWDPDTARFEMSGDGLVVDFDNFYPHEFEIAGNIHDNPELLEESQ